MSQLDVWVAIAPSTDPNQGIVVGATTRVFTRTASGSLVRANRCVIATGDLVEVWTGFQGPPQYSLGEPPPVYSAVQIAVHQ
ncbi:MAG TPA: hypothetical protein VIC55_05285 [Gemmatimonadaceae bacterium]|jgi:hypothetical protein